MKYYFVESWPTKIPKKRKKKKDEDRNIIHSLHGSVLSC